MLREVSAGASARIRRDGAGADFRAATAAADGSAAARPTRKGEQGSIFHSIWAEIG